MLVLRRRAFHLSDPLGQRIPLPACPARTVVLEAPQQRIRSPHPPPELEILQRHLPRSAFDERGCSKLFLSRTGPRGKLSFAVAPAFVAGGAPPNFLRLLIVRSLLGPRLLRPRLLYTRFLLCIGFLDALFLPVRLRRDSVRCASWRSRSLE